jgi:hypothetical protein
VDKVRCDFSMGCPTCDKRQRVIVWTLEELAQVLEKHGWEYLAAEWRCPECATQWWCNLDDVTMMESLNEG